MQPQHTVACFQRGFRRVSEPWPQHAAAHGDLCRERPSARPPARRHASAGRRRHYHRCVVSPVNRSINSGRGSRSTHKHRGEWRNRSRYKWPFSSLPSELFALLQILCILMHPSSLVLVVASLTMTSPPPPPQWWRPSGQPPPSASVWPCTTAPCAPSCPTRRLRETNHRWSTSSGICCWSRLASPPSPSLPPCCPASSSPTSFAPGWFCYSSPGGPRRTSWKAQVGNGFTELLWASSGTSTGSTWLKGAHGTGRCCIMATYWLILFSSAVFGSGRRSAQNLLIFRHHQNTA